MGQQALVHDLAAQAASEIAAVRNAAAQKVVSLEESLAKRRLSYRNQEWRAARRKRTRAGRIAMGLKGLATAGRQPEILELIRLRGPLTIWGAVSSAGVGWEHQWGIVLTEEAVVIFDEVFIGGKQDAAAEPLRVEFGYDCITTWSQSSWLFDLCGHTPTIDFRDYEGMAMLDEEQSCRELLWQHVAECANPKALVRYMRSAIGS
ncbi:MAG TPA: hypothetical protein VEA92_01445 [Candidatus Paceibacterota bacterium]|nr:hypothetical protein [Candidatus Paceibacterota bacterium]